MPAACSASRSAAVCGSVAVSLTNSVPPLRMSSVRLPPRSVHRSIGLRREPVHVLVDDRAVLTVDLAVADAVDPQVHTEHAACLAENARRIGERPDRVAQFSQERMPIADSAQRFLGARARIGDPDALGGNFDQLDLIWCPDARRGVVDSEHSRSTGLSLISGTVDRTPRSRPRAARHAQRPRSADRCERR